MSEQLFRHILGTDLLLTTTSVDQDGTAIDISNGEAFLTVKSAKEDADSDAKLSVTGTSLTNAGVAIFTITDALIADITPGRYVYSIRVKTAGGLWYQSFQGEYIIEDAVTVRTS